MGTIFFVLFSSFPPGWWSGIPDSEIELEKLQVCRRFLIPVRPGPVRGLSRCVRCVAFIFPPPLAEPNKDRVVTTSGTRIGYLLPLLTTTSLTKQGPTDCSRNRNAFLFVWKSSLRPLFCNACAFLSLPPPTFPTLLSREGCGTVVKRVNGNGQPSGSDLLISRWLNKQAGCAKKKKKTGTTARKAKQRMKCTTPGMQRRHGHVFFKTNKSRGC